jgi:hypothetical protein
LIHGSLAGLAPISEDGHLHNDVHERAIWPSLRFDHPQMMVVTRTSNRTARPTCG